MTFKIHNPSHLSHDLHGVDTCLPSDRGNGRWLLPVCGVALTLGTWLSFGVDAAWSAALRGWDLPGDLRKAVNLSEVFAHGLGAAAILLCVLLVCKRSRSQVWLAITITALSGLTANGMKSCFVRIRPHSEHRIRVEVQSPPGDAAVADWRGTQAAEEAVPASFWDARQRSFPSGHAATAWALAIGLGLLFPEAVVLFVALAALASLQRVESGAHFLSDVMAGSAIAFWTATLLIWLPKRRRARDRRELQPLKSSAEAA